MSLIDYSVDRLTIVVVGSVVMSLSVTFLCVWTEAPLRLEESFVAYGRTLVIAFLVVNLSNLISICRKTTVFLLLFPFFGAVSN